MNIRQKHPEYGNPVARCIHYYPESEETFGSGVSVCKDEMLYKIGAGYGPAGTEYALFSDITRILPNGDESDDSPGFEVFYLTAEQGRKCMREMVKKGLTTLLPPGMSRST